MAIRNATLAARSVLRKRTTWLPDTLHSAQIVVLSFAAVILCGAFLLTLPGSSRTGQPLSFLDALFTAASATCVTGLTVVDTGTRFSAFGQIVILCCIQLGGLGLMTFTTVFMVATGRRLSIADRIAIQESFFHSPTGKLGTLVGYIAAATLLTEAAGALLLFAKFHHDRRYDTMGEALYSGVFHSISAFCNAGFSLYSDSAMRFQNDPYVLLVLSGLILSGGLGFLVGLDVKEYLQQRYLARWFPPPVHERVRRIRPRPRLSLHTKFVLTMTGSLLAVGAVSYFILERDGLFRDMDTSVAWLNAIFCSVTARTAGFNTVDYGLMGGAGLLCTMVLMFIGASPGSTGGGVKTSTFGVLLTYAVFRWRGHAAPHAFSRSIPPETVDRATSIVILGVAVVILGGSLLMAAEAGPLHDPAASQARFLPVMFETFSAFGTVGLSMNYTPKLTALGKLAVCALMFVGRVGPLTLALAIGSRRRHAKFTYAEENVMVG